MHIYWGSFIQIIFTFTIKLNALSNTRQHNSKHDTTESLIPIENDIIYTYSSEIAVTQGDEEKHLDSNSIQHNIPQ